ncbi:hypothetical protein ABPG75_013286 [Micractinium tetrahymenae]
MAAPEGSPAASNPGAASAADSAASAPELLRSLVGLLCEEQPLPEAAQQAGQALRERVNSHLLVGGLEGLAVPLPPAALAELREFVRTAAQLAPQATGAFQALVASMPPPAEAHASPNQKTLLGAHCEAFTSISAAFARLAMSERQAEWQEAAGSSVTQQQHEGQPAVDGDDQQQQDGEQAAVSQADQVSVVNWILQALLAIFRHFYRLQHEAAFRDCRPCCLCCSPVVQFIDRGEGSEVQALLADEHWLAHAAVLTARDWRPWEREHPRRDLRRAAVQRAAAMAAAREAKTAGRLQAQQAGRFYYGYQEEPEEDEEGDWGYGDEGYSRHCHLSKRGFLRGNMIQVGMGFWTWLQVAGWPPQGEEVERSEGTGLLLHAACRGAWLSFQTFRVSSHWIARRKSQIGACCSGACHVAVQPACENARP